jgi:hypothetical protein
LALVLAGDGAEVGFTAAPGADQGNVQLVAGGVGPEEFGARKNERAGADEGGRFEELASLHVYVSRLRGFVVAVLDAVIGHGVRRRKIKNGSQAVSTVSQFSPPRFFGRVLANHL